MAPSDPVTLSFDWNAEVRDNRATFHVWVDRGDRHNAFDINVNLARLQQPHLEALRNVLARRHEDLSKAPEMAATIRWLLGIALAQQGLGPDERAARIRELMLCPPEFPSPKERLFEAHDSNFLQQSTLKDWYEQTKLLRDYPEVRESWQPAVRAFNIGTPKLKADSPEEQDELELFFLRLRYESMASAFAVHASLADKWSSNPRFRSAVADIITRQPEQKEMPLEYYILCGWLTSCLWLLDNDDRAILLNRVYGVTLVAADRIRKAVKQLALKDWTDFQPKGTKAPCHVEVWTEEGQQWCQISPKM